MKKLWKLEQNIAAGLFTATEEEVLELIGKEVCFGELTGGFSGTTSTIRAEEISLISNDPIVADAIDKFGETILRFPEKD